jgi:two-component system, chemotaxis family, sensor kinase CheA
MVPLKATFQKMTRLVRDVAQKVGKEVDFRTEGEETEIDRNMVDLLADPLVHMLRNSIDHGLECPDERVTAGKPRHGLVALTACHASGSVVVTIRDDGRGLDRDKIMRKAVSRGIVDADKGLSDPEVFNLIFAPGFSTADTVTDVSGRGVGLDVVRRNVEAMRGRITIQSRHGEGTTFTIYLPLTLAVTEGMLVRVGRHRYILPIGSIAKTFRPAAAELSSVVGQGEMVAYQGRHVPLFRLSRLFAIDEAIDDPTAGLLIVLRDGTGFFALLADEILGQQQIVVKSLGEGIAKTRGISGGAILGDGRVGLILDPAELGSVARGMNAPATLA